MDTLFWKCHIDHLLCGLEWVRSGTLGGKQAGKFYRLALNSPLRHCWLDQESNDGKFGSVRLGCQLKMVQANQYCTFPEQGGLVPSETTSIAIEQLLPRLFRWEWREPSSQVPTLAVQSSQSSSSEPLSTVSILSVYSCFFFLSNRFASLTQATDTTNIRLVFAAVKETILQNALRDSGILWSDGRFSLCPSYVSRLSFSLLFFSFFSLFYSPFCFASFLFFNYQMGIGVNGAHLAATLGVGLGFIFSSWISVVPVFSICLFSIVVYLWRIIHEGLIYCHIGRPLFDPSVCINESGMSSFFIFIFITLFSSPSSIYNESCSLCCIPSLVLTTQSFYYTWSFRLAPLYRRNGKTVFKLNLR